MVALYPYLVINEPDMDHESKGPALAACRRLLQPLARLLLRCGVTWKEFVEVSKTAFVEVATKEFGIRGRPTNASRVSILTGIPRHEVSRRRALIASGEPALPTYLSAATRVLSGWHQDPEFHDGSRGPRRLAIQGPGLSFEELSRRYGGDVPMSALLKELRSVGAVEQSEDGLLRALKRAYIPRQLDPEKTLRAGSVLQDIGDTVVHDLICGKDEPLRFERRATNAFVHEHALPKFREFLEREGQEFLERVDAWLTANAVANGTSDECRSLRLGVGIYHIQDDKLSTVKK